MDYPLAVAERGEQDAALVAIRSELGDEAFRAALDAGTVLDIDSATKSAEEELNWAGSSASR